MYSMLELDPSNSHTNARAVFVLDTLPNIAFEVLMTAIPVGDRPVIGVYLATELMGEPFERQFTLRETVLDCAARMPVFMQSNPFLADMLLPSLKEFLLEAKARLA